MDKVRVSLKERSHDVLVGENILANAKDHVSELADNFIIITDSNVRKLHAEKISNVLNAFVIEIPSGESSKNLQTVESVYTQLLEHKANRSTAILAVGGGVVGDIAGFIAATFMRGLPLIQVPTTLLAQVDSSIGGKTGVDLTEGKNLVGAFYQPRLVLTDTAILGTLPKDELLNGLAEVVKYAVIKDPSIFKLLEKPFAEVREEIVTRCAQIKARIVEQDEHETGVRMILNYGHTFAHGIEQASNYAIPHGHAVAIGMECASRLAESQGILEESMEAQTKVLTKLGLPTQLPAEIDRVQILEAMEHDKKRSASLRFILPKKIGEVIIQENIPEEKIREALQ